MKFFEDDWLTIHQGDVRDVLPEIASDSVDCIVTSPPYWGLRDYGTAAWSGGDAECDHKAPPSGGTVKGSTLVGTGNREGFSSDGQYRHTCGKCGAVRQDSQLGLERTPEEYVANMVAVFRELRRVLKPSGTCWLNLGDSYAASRSYQVADSKWTDVGNSKASEVPAGLKPKDLVGIPWRVAFALQADGWYLRSDIIWAKPNPMPESVTDRPTKAHEYLFLLTKSARYYFDADAVREAVTQSSLDRIAQPNFANQTGGPKDYANGTNPNRSARKALKNFAESAGAGRNLRSVWTIATRPYPGAHFAVFPPELPERCIKAGSSERGVCPETGEPWRRVVESQTTGRTAENGKGNGELASGARFGDSTSTTTGWEPTCGAPWERVVEYGEIVASGPNGLADKPRSSHRRPDATPLDDRPVDGYGDLPRRERTTTGWRPTCNHDAEPVPAVVLDPFAGSGTTGMVANRLSRRAILIDLNGDYLKQQLKRNAQTPLGLGA